MQIGLMPRDARIGQFQGGASLSCCGPVAVTRLPSLEFASLSVSRESINEHCRGERVDAARRTL